jgi:cytochrome P450
MTMALQFDPFSYDVQQDPYPYYAALHGVSPVAWLDAFQAFVVTGFDEARSIAMRPNAFSSAGLIQRFFGDLSPVPEVPWLIDLDPPRHPEVRRLVNRTFTARRVEGFIPRIVEIVAELVDGMRAKESFDLVHDLAEPLPVIAIAELLGVANDRHGDFVRWSDDIMRSVNKPTDPQVIAGIRTTIAEFREHFLSEIADRRRAPRDDLLTSLVAIQQEEGLLSEYDVLALCVIILMAGNETTRRAIGNTMIALLENPAQMDALAQSPDLLAQAIEEGVRFNSPILGVPRVVVEDSEVGATRITAPNAVMVMWGMANRDPRHFKEPDRFDITRSPNDHLGFGIGNHFCLGAPLARREVYLALNNLLFECPGFVRVNEVTQWDPTPLNRGLVGLPLKWVS